MVVVAAASSSLPSSSASSTLILVRTVVKLLVIEAEEAVVKTIVRAKCLLTVGCQQGEVAVVSMMLVTSRTDVMKLARRL